ncbi:MAG: hypothetical protein IIA89_14695 [Chloroflexi bacterium]|nr:hypothetical protein [Chloroflexota bacterium]
MEENEFDPVLLEKIESDIVPLIEQLAEKTIEQAKTNPGELVSAPVPFIIDDDVMYEDGKFIFLEFHGDIVRTENSSEILDLVVTAWVTHVMSELDEGDEYSFEDLMRIINEQLHPSA